MNELLLHHPLVSELRQTRGAAYYKVLNQIMADIGEKVKADFDAMRGEDSITVGDIAVLCTRTGLPFKTMTEWLEREAMLPTGTFDMLKANGLKVNKIMAAVQDRV